MLLVTDILEQALGKRPVIRGVADRYAKNPPPVVVWNITNHCNMACPHCYSSASLRKVPDDLGYPDALRVIEKLKEAGIRILIVSGGEPLLRPEAMQLIAQARAAKMQCHLSTNGVLLTSERCVKLKSLEVHYVGVSIDGLQNFNDKHRHYVGGFEDALQGLANARAAGLRTGLRITLSRENESQLFPLIKISEERGIDRFYISHLVYGGRGVGYARRDQERQHTRSTMVQVFDYALESIQAGRPLQVVTGGNDADGPLLYLYIKEKFGSEVGQRVYAQMQMRGGNSAGEKMINIDHKGNVHPDQFWRTVSPGNILDTSLADILQKPLMQDLRRRVDLLKGRCGRCTYQSICRGSHRERAEVVHGDIWAEDPACYMLDAEINGVAEGFEQGQVLAELTL